MITDEGKRMSKPSAVEPAIPEHMRAEWPASVAQQEADKIASQPVAPVPEGAPTVTDVPVPRKSRATD